MQAWLKAIECKESHCGIASQIHQTQSGALTSIHVSHTRLQLEEIFSCSNGMRLDNVGAELGALETYLVTSKGLSASFDSSS